MSSSLEFPMESERHIFAFTPKNDALVSTVSPVNSEVRFDGFIHSLFCHTHHQLWSETRGTAF